MKKITFTGYALAVLPLFLSSAQAGVFTTPRFVSPGEFSLGLEPELTLSHGAGLAANGRFTQGISDLTNATAIIGTGGGPRRFRVGGNLSFDFFPDTEGQPGIGLATQALYYRVPGDGRLELTAIPYIHKSFLNGDNKSEIDPYFAFPVGVAFISGTYQSISTAVVGASFKGSEQVRYVMEIGIAVNNTESYISGGIAYYH